MGAIRRTSSAGDGRGFRAGAGDRAAAGGRGRAGRVLRHRGRRGREDRGRDRRARRHRPARTGSTCPIPTRCTTRSTRRGATSAARSVVVNCAGIGRFAHTHEMPFEDWQRIIGVNLTGTFLVCQAALPHLLDGGGVDRQHRVERGHQGAAVLGRVLRVEGRRRAPHAVPRRRVPEAQGVRVNCVAPGGMETPLQEAFMEFPEGVDWKELRKVMSPLGNSHARGDRERRRVHRVRRLPLHDGLDRLDRRRHHGLSARCAMLDDARAASWELIERRAGGDARSRDAVRRRPHRRRSREYQDAGRARGRRLCTRSASAPATNVSWQLPTWTESAVLVGALCRLGAMQNPMLPIYRYREVSFIAKQTGLQAADHAVDVEQVRLRRAGRTGRGRERRHAHARRRPLEPRRRSRRRCRPRPRSSTTRPTIRCVGSSTRRARPPTRRARSTPTAPRSRARSATRRRRTWSPTTSRSSRSRSRTSAASSSACSRRCSPARPRC